MDELNKLKQEVEDLKAWKRSLENQSSIPLNIHQSFMGRFPTFVTSTKSATSENIVYDPEESVTTLDTPDYWVELKNISPAPDGKRVFVPVWRANYDDPPN
jgi:hypothetical protein